MSLEVTQRPLVQSGSGSMPNEFRWNAVGNPILYKMQRKDFEFDQINDNGGFVQLQFNGVDIRSSFANGDSLYVKSDDNNYDGFGLQTAEAYSGGNTLITTDIPYTSAATTGFANNDTLKPLYRVEVEVYNNSGDKLLTEEPFSYSPDPYGALTFPVNVPLRANLLPDNESDLTSITDKTFTDENINFEFYIKYREVWTGSAESQTDDSSEVFHVVLGAMQIPSLYGGNLLEYTAMPGNVANWLTRFERPVMWRDWPFTLSVIIENADWDSTIRIKKDGSTEVQEIIYFGLRQVAIGNYDLGDISETKILTAEIYNDADAEIVTDSIEVELRDNCDNPVMLFGRNSLGGVMQWLFEGSQEYDWDYGNGIKNKRLVLVAENLTLNQWEALQDFITLGEVYRNNIVEFTSNTIKTSSRIGQQLYVVDQEGNKIGVVCVATKNKTLTRYAKHRFEIEIEFPEVFTV